jgi:hypothetical protein
MTLTILDQLSEEDRRRYLDICVRRESLTLNPRLYTREETEEIFRDDMEFLAYVATEYSPEADELWRISPVDGTIYYGCCE